MASKHGRIVIFYLNITIFGCAAFCGLSGCGVPRSPELAAQFDAARRSGVVVVDWRRAVNDSGGRNTVDPLWAANAVPGGPAPVAPHDLRLVDDPRIVFIFVHGYNVTAIEALTESMTLSQEIRESNKRLQLLEPRLPNTGALAFVAFLWRGDFGEIHFPTAQHAAENTAACLLISWKTVVRVAPHAKIVVLTHSLGAEVVLEAFRAMREASDRPVVDNLILVQGAVPAVPYTDGQCHTCRYPLGQRRGNKTGTA